MLPSWKVYRLPASSSQAQTEYRQCLYVSGLTPIFNFYTPSKDRFGRPILTCVCESEYGSVECEITYQAIGKLAELTPQNFEEAAVSFRKFSHVIKKLWAKRIIEQGCSVASTICINARDLHK